MLGIFIATFQKKIFFEQITISANLATLFQYMFFRTWSREAAVYFVHIWRPMKQKSVKLVHSEIKISHLLKSLKRHRKKQTPSFNGQCCLYDS